MSKECRAVVVAAKMKRTSYRGVIDVVYGGEKPLETAKGGEVEREKGKKGKGKQQALNGQKKRKAEVMEDGGNSTPVTSLGMVEKPVSKRQMKRQAKQARLSAGLDREDTVGGAENGAASAPVMPTHIEEQEKT